MRVIGHYDETNWFGDVHVDGRILTPTRSLKVWNHSPDGFSWGYSGSGPAQLALALLLEHGLSDEEAIEHHQRFKFDFIAPIKRESFAIEIDVAAWLEKQRESH